MAMKKFSITWKPLFSNYWQSEINLFLTEHSTHAFEHFLFKGPEEFKLTEDKTDNGQGDLVDGEYQQYAQRPIDKDIGSLLVKAQCLGERTGYPGGKRPVDGKYNQNQDYL